jgi:hypothetical protein
MLLVVCLPIGLPVVDVGFPLDGMAIEPFSTVLGRNGAERELAPHQKRTTEIRPAFRYSAQLAG